MRGHQYRTFVHRPPAPAPIKAKLDTLDDIMADRPPVSVTLAQLLSATAMTAFSVTAYRMRHNVRYVGWFYERRLQHCLKKAFEAAARVR